jgi:hypothetical protein
MEEGFKYENPSSAASNAYEPHIKTTN